MRLSSRTFPGCGHSRERPELRDFLAAQQAHQVALKRLALAEEGSSSGGAKLGLDQVGDLGRSINTDEVGVGGGEVANRGLGAGNRVNEVALQGAEAGLL